MKTAKTGSSEDLRLSNLYALESDEKLLHLQLSYGELTDAAQNALREELIKRGIWPTGRQCDDESLSAEADEAEDSDLIQAWISVWEAKSPEEAEVVCQLLKLAGITAVARPLRSQILRIVQVHVEPDHAQRAITVLSNGVPEEVAKELASQFVSDKFAIPCCPWCDSVEVTLDAVGITNHWRCGKCGGQWNEDLEKSSAEFSSEEKSLESEVSTDIASTPAPIPGSLEWRSIKSNRQSIGLFVLGTLVAILASWYQPWTALRVLGLCLFIPSGILLTIARFQLGASFSVHAEARTLITHGLYSRLQNPIYLFGGLTLAGLILFLNKPLYLIVFVIVIPVQFIRVARERRVLAEKFGDSYLQYRRQTWF